VAVASHDEGGDVSWFSTRGAYVDVSAPGSGIVSTYKDGRWSYMSGTSMASPHVAGAAAVLLAAEPALTPAQLRARIVSSAADRGPIGHDTSFGWGLMDLASALAG
jgi:subtilisin family serine protease